MSIEAKDGVPLSAVLTTPLDGQGPWPFVVVVHGGPAHHVKLGFDTDAQLLASRGYGVLAVNFRGSTGFGKAFQAMGFRQFGRAMQDDLEDAAQWLIETGRATDIAVSGSSYGGYAALMAMTRETGLFSAAVAEIPMVDVSFQAQYHPWFRSDGIDGWQRDFGDWQRSEDRALMDAYSPVNRVAEIRGNVMVLAGVRDEVVAVQQIRNFEEAARASDREVDFHYFAGAGHGFVTASDRMRRARLIENFLDQHLGGAAAAHQSGQSSTTPTE